MNRKIGRFKMWQLLAMGGGLGLALYLYKKGHEGGAETTGLAASVPNPGLAGGSGSLGEGGISAPGAPGAPGEPGPVGAPGVVPAEIIDITSRLAALESGPNNNQPLPSATMKPAHSSGVKFPLVNPRTGEHYRIVKEHGKTIHVYHNGHRVVVGGAKHARKSNNAKHQAKRHAKSRAHPANPNHHASHAAPVAPHNHSRPVPVKHRVHKKAHKRSR